jgi:hypothetical protein
MSLKRPGRREWNPRGDEENHREIMRAIMVIRRRGKYKFDIRGNRTGNLWEGREAFENCWIASHRKRGQI